MYACMADRDGGCLGEAGERRALFRDDGRGEIWFGGWLCRREQDSRLDWFAVFGIVGDCILGR